MLQVAEQGHHDAEEAEDDGDAHSNQPAARVTCGGQGSGVALVRARVWLTQAQGTGSSFNRVRPWLSK
jgi:hypothetical protein